MADRRLQMTLAPAEGSRGGKRYVRMARQRLPAAARCLDLLKAVLCLAASILAGLVIGQLY